MLKNRDLDTFLNLNKIIFFSKSIEVILSSDQEPIVMLSSEPKLKPVK